MACLQEALDLRAGGITKPILILGHTSAEYASQLASHTVTQTVVDESAAEELSEAARAAGVTVDVHIKLDTGMSRAGLLAQGAENGMEAAKAAERICRLPNLHVSGMYTHFSVADTPSEDAYTVWQLENYMRVYNYLCEKGLRPETCHTSNSACILSHPETQIDMVREGVILYGMYPDSVPQQGELRPVMTLKTRVSQVRDLPAGTTVSYGRTYRSETPFRTAVVLAGYAGWLSAQAFGQHDRHHPAASATRRWAASAWICAWRTSPVRMTCSAATRSRSSAAIPSPGKRRPRRSAPSIMS